MDWLDSSKLDTFHLCPQKYAWRYEQNLRAIGDDTSALDFGFAIHAALELLYKNEGFNKVACPYGPCAFCKGDDIPALAARFLELYPTDPDDPKNPRTRSRGLEMLEVYLAKWAPEPFKVLAVEVPFELQMANDFHVVGRMDLIVEWNRIMPLDHKSTSQFGHLFERQFKLSNQCTTYIVACQSVTGETVGDACINALRVTSRIDPDQSFYRLITTRGPDEINRWRWEMIDTIRRIREHRETDIWPRNAPYACVAYNKLCEYYPLCTSGHDAQRALIESAYKVEVWDPRTTK